MAGIFTERIWQPCICQPNEIKRKTKKNWGGHKGTSKNRGVHGLPRPPLRIATGAIRPGRKPHWVSSPLIQLYCGIFFQGTWQRKC